MKVLVQWAHELPGNWQEVDSGSWGHLPARGVPTSKCRVDGERGWIQSINIQGVLLSGDHYAIEERPDGRVVAYVWSDDPDDWKAGEYWGHRLIFGSLAPCPSIGGALTTCIEHTIYGPQGSLPFSKFNPPKTCHHGIWLPDGLHEKHNQTRSVRGWREWGGGLAASELDNGRVRMQRKAGRWILPDGTRTYFHNPAALAIGAIGAPIENQLGTTAAGGPTTEQVTGLGGNGELAHAAASPAGEPNSAAWPTGNYRAQLDVTSVDVDLEFGLLTLGNADGGFMRFDSTLGTLLETRVQQEAAFSLTGLKLATTGSVSWTAGNATDRYGYAIAAVRTAGHGNKQLTLELGETDDFTDGPWPAAVAVTDNAPFYGANF